MKYWLNLIKSRISSYLTKYWLKIHPEIGYKTPNINILLCSGTVLLPLKCPNPSIVCKFKDLNKNKSKSFWFIQLILYIKCQTVTKQALIVAELCL